MKANKTSKLSTSDYHIIHCSECNEPQRVTTNIVKVLCGMCVQNHVEPPSILLVGEKRETGFPRGWTFYETFVHEDGRVYKRGVEQPDLKGTLPSTKIEKKQKKHSQHKFIKEEQRMHKLAKIHNDKNKNS